MRLHLCTWPQVEAYLARSNAVVLPIGSTEQHGPTGLIGTDALCAEAIARGVGERLEAMVAPTLPVGMAQHHMAFPGSMTLKPSTLLALLEDCLLSLARHGFARVLVVNGHGGNAATLSAAFAETQMVLDGWSPRPDFRTRLVNWWELAGIDRLSAELYGDAVGSHATPPEVAVTWSLFPETADARVLKPRIAARAPFHSAADFRARFPDGRIGSDPSLAKPEHGARLLAAAVDEIAEIGRAFFSAP
ncbi:creatininase family protein [Magnetospirillum sp. UT-4]|uniref:creatininase family protein n=1 Tax=Magnetospirillum sp. UT-4 TaxID=2681467 RepID=UPI0013850375|nr:creatininase family protein [Magnetospirillum sp. UT-4]CAA7611818.1 Creatininase [Magnetospirillum sp. UT-4]